MSTFAVEIPCSIARLDEGVATFSGGQITLRIVATDETDALHRVRYAIERIANSAVGTLPPRDDGGDHDDGDEPT